MTYQDLYWNLFTQSGDPEAYVEYRRFAHNSANGSSRTSNPSYPSQSGQSGESGFNHSLS